MKNLQILFPKDIRFYLQEFLPICACEALLSNFFSISLQNLTQLHGLSSTVFKPVCMYKS